MDSSALNPGSEAPPLAEPQEAPAAAKDTPTPLLELLLAAQASSGPAAQAGLVLVGEVLTCTGTHARVRWRTPAGVAHEVEAESLQAQGPRPGSQVLFVQPANRSLAVILGLLPGGQAESAQPETSASALTPPVQGPDIQPPPAPLTGVQASVDGRRVELTAQDEVVLKCGDASITLRRNGRIVIRGAYVESHAKGTNRIKGGSVLIN